jgi:hypothetical protein
LQLRPPVVVLLIAGLSVGCTSVPKPPPYAPGVGAESCNEIRRAASDLATENYAAGGVALISGLVGVGAAMAIGPDTSPDAGWADRSGFLLIGVPSAVLASAGAILIANALRAEKLAERTSAVLADGKTEADRFVYYQCVSARADWSGDHSDLARLQIMMMKENLAHLGAARETAAEARETAATASTQAQSAQALSVEAKASATKASQIASASAEATRDLAAVTEMLVETGSKEAVSNKVAVPVDRTPKPAPPRPDATARHAPAPRADISAPAPRVDAPVPAPRADAPAPAASRPAPASLNERR